MIAILSTMLTKDLTMRKGIGSHEVMKARSPSSVTQDRHRVAIAPKVLCINKLIFINSIFNLNNLWCHFQSSSSLSWSSSSFNTMHLNIFLYPVQGGYLVKDPKVTWDPTRGSAVHVQETCHSLFVKSGYQVPIINSPHQRLQVYSWWWRRRRRRRLPELSRRIGCRWRE